MTPSRLLLLAVSTLSLLALGGCTKWTGIEAPAAVGASETFEISVSDVFVTPPGQDGFEIPGGEAFGLVYSVVMPADWTPPDIGTYKGNWDGNAFTADAVKVDSPPDTDLLALFESQNGPLPPEEGVVLTALDCNQNQPVPPPGSKLVWYRVGPPTAEYTIRPGDTGTLTLEMVAGPTVAPAQVTFQHAIYLNLEGGGAPLGLAQLGGGDVPQALAQLAGADIPLNLAVVAGDEPPPEEPEPEICIWGFDLENVEGSLPDDPEDLPEFYENLPEKISAQFNVLAESVPIMGGGLLALLAALMVLVGIRVGRR